VGWRDARQHDVAPSGDESAAERAARHAELPLALAEQPARAVDRACCDPHRRRDLLRARAAHEAGAPAGAGGRAAGRGARPRRGLTQLERGGVGRPAQSSRWTSSSSPSNSGPSNSATARSYFSIAQPQKSKSRSETLSWIEPQSVQPYFDIRP